MEKLCQNIMVVKDNKNKTFTRNKYLQEKLDILNPAIINAAIKAGMQKSNSIWPNNVNMPGYYLIKPLEPMCFGMQFSKQRARSGYGLESLNRIIHDLGSCRKCKIKQALIVLLDLLQNPFEYNRAVNDFSIIKRLEDVLFRCLPETSEKVTIIKLIFQNFLLISEQHNGAVLMMKQFNLIDTLYDLLLCDSRANRICAKILSNLSSYQLIAEEMLYYNHIDKIRTLFDKSTLSLDLNDLYIHLSHLIALNPEEAMHHGFFKFLINKLKILSPVQRMIIKCFGLILNCKECNISMDNHDGIKILYDLISSDCYDNDTLEYIALAFQNSTISKKSIWRCREFWDLPNILLRRAYNTTNDNLQIYSLQILRQITSMPSIKNFVRRTFKRKLINLVCRTEAANKLKANLLKWLRLKVYIYINNNSNKDVYENLFSDTD